jgi:hypothetical protein
VGACVRAQVLTKLHTKYYPMDGGARDVRVSFVSLWGVFVRVCCGGVLAIAIAIAIAISITSLTISHATSHPISRSISHEPSLYRCC